MNAPTPPDPRRFGPLLERIPALAGPRAAFRIGPGRTLVWRPDARIDERLVLLRMFEFLHSKLPRDLEDGRAAAAVAAVRGEFVRGAAAPGSTPQLAALFAESAALLARLSQWLCDAGVLAACREDASLCEAPAYVGVEAVAATPASAALALEEAAFDWIAKRALAPAEALALRRRFGLWIHARHALLARAAALADDFGAERGWAPGEAGFDSAEPQEEAELLLSAEDDDDRDFFHRRMLQLRPHRRRDPFFSASQGALRVLWAESAHDAGDDDEAAALLSAAVDALLQAVHRAPADPFFDPFRSDCLLAAACAAEALAYHAQAVDDLPLVLADAARRSLPHDPGGRIAHVRALALARCGRCVEGAALRKQSLSKRPADADLHYDLAALFSLSGRTEEALAHLQEALRLGRGDVRWIRRDRDLDNLRRDRPVQFERLVSPTWSFAAEAGGAMRAAAARNHSPFPLHNVALQAAWRGGDGEERSEVYWADGLAPGADRRFRGVFAGADVSAVSQGAVQVTLVCDENRPLHPPSTTEVVGLWTGTATLLPKNGGDAQVKGSSPMRLHVEPAGGPRLRLEIEDSDAVIRLTAASLRDGRAEAVSQNRGFERAALFFRGDLLYGWRQSSDDDARGDLRAFWLHR